MKVKCLKSDDVEYLTIGKEYEVVKYDEHDNIVSFHNNKGELWNYDIYYNSELWFEIVKNENEDLEVEDCIQIMYENIIDNKSKDDLLNALSNISKSYHNERKKIS